MRVSDNNNYCQNDPPHWATNSWFNDNFLLSFDLGQKRIDLMNVLKKAAEKGVVYEVANLKKAFIMEEKGENIIKVINWLIVRISEQFSFGALQRLFFFTFKAMSEINTRAYNFNKKKFFLYCQLEIFL